MTARFAPVATLPVYRRLWAAQQLGDYHLLIATEILKDPVGWKAFWGLQPAVGRFIIMDNGLIETGIPTSPEALRTAARLVNANCIVLPDKLGDFRETRRLARAALTRKLDFPRMGVVQGRTMLEVADCIRFYRAHSVEYLSVPRVMVSIFGSRTPIIDLINESRSGDQIHLLGFSDNLYDDMRCTALPNVMGIDSATPLWIAWQPLREYLPLVPPRDTRVAYGSRPSDYWNYVPGDDFDIAVANVQKVRSWIARAAQGALLG